MFSRVHYVLMIMGFAMASTALAAEGPCDASQILTEARPTTLWAHQLVLDFVSGELVSNTQLSSHGYAGPRAGYSRHPNVVFVRDYFPVLWKKPDGSTLALSYRAPILNSEMASAPTGQSFVPHTRVEVQLELEGGNLLQAGNRLITSVKSIDRNGGDRAQVVGKLSAALAIAPEQVIVLPWMPGERTGHVDMWIGVLSDSVVAVPYVPEPAIVALQHGREQVYARRINGWLDAQVNELQAAGLVVERLPMLPPRRIVESRVSEFGLDSDFASPVNWVVRGNRVFVPHFKNAMQELPFAVREAIDWELRQKLARYGFEARFTEASSLLPVNGLLHCVTAEW